MRTLRLSLVGTVILMLLGGLGSAVLAQSGAPSDDTTWPKLTRSLEYGDDPKQVVHVYELEPRAEPRPAVVWFHGGGNVYGEPDWNADQAEWIAEHGYVTFNAGYRLFDESTGDNPWPAQIDDAQRVIRWVRAHADEFNVDPERVCAIGHSSGGTLAALLGMTDETTDDDPALDGISSRVDCVVSLAGTGDLLVPFEFTWAWEMVLGGSLDERPDLFEAASPAHNVDEETVPSLIIQGALDEYIPVEMPLNLVGALSDAGREVVYALIGHQGHEGILMEPSTWDLVDVFFANQLHPES